MIFSRAKLTLSVIGLILSTCGAVESRAQDKTKLVEALQSSPSPANSIAYLHVPSLSKLASDANMDAQLSDKVEEVWQIAQIDPFTLHPRWEAGNATLKHPANAEAIAQAYGGYVDEIAGKRVVWTPRQSYLIPQDNRVGFLRPADRTLLSSWVTSTTRRDPSRFLLQQAQQPEQYLSFMLAIDLENALSPVALGQRLGNLDTLKGQDLKSVASVMASTKGISIIIGRKSLKQCILAVEFGQSPAQLQPFAREMLNEILNRSGSSAPEVLEWDVKVDGNKLMFQGAITEASLDGLIGILSIQGHADHAAQASSSKPQTDVRGSTPYETKAYFDRVLKLVKRTEEYEAQTTGYRAKWNDINAKRIDELPSLGVDSEMVAYGANVARLLRENSAAIRGVNVATGQQQAAQGLEGGYYASGGYYGGYYGGSYGGVSGYYDPNSTSDYQMVAGAQARMAGFGSFANTMTQIDQLTGDVRRRMTEKFGTQF
jgi:hypothetical protein